MENFVEIQQFGLNMLTATFLATLLFTVLQGYVLIKQNNKIVLARSGKSVSFLFFSYYSFSALSIIIYGLTKNSLALTLNGFLGIASLLIVINLLRFKVMSVKEKIIGLSTIIIIPIFAFAPQKDSLLLFFGLIFGAMLVFQIIEIWMNKSSGSVHAGPIFISIFSTSFWLVYAVIIQVRALEILNLVGIILWLALLLSYLKFKNR